MIPATINNQTYFFTIQQITKEAGNKYLYSLRLNNGKYILTKTFGVDDGVQVDTNPTLAPEMLHEMSNVLTEIELKYKKRPPLEFFNREIFSSLIRHRNSGSYTVNRNVA